ncbi:unnamed protein product, partial [Staurois parvus]
ERRRGGTLAGAAALEGRGRTLGRRVNVVPALTGILLHCFPLSGRAVHLGTWLSKATGWLFIIVLPYDLLKAHLHTRCITFITKLHSAWLLFIPPKER